MARSEVVQSDLDTELAQATEYPRRDSDVVERGVLRDLESDLVALNASRGQCVLDEYHQRRVTELRRRHVDRDEPARLLRRQFGRQQARLGDQPGCALV